MAILAIKDQLVYKGRLVIQDIKVRPVPALKVLLVILAIQVLQVIQDTKVLQGYKVSQAILVTLDLQV